MSEAKKYVVYTCVFNNYDTVFPPIRRSPHIDYFIITDNAKLNVPGWKVIVADESESDFTYLNRKYKLNPWLLFSAYDCSLYLDGNIRVKGDLYFFMEDFYSAGRPLGLFSHPLRSSVAEELESCLKGGKLEESASYLAEQDYYKSMGFRDDVGLTENSVLLRNHNSVEAKEICAQWWALYDRYRTRDQLSLPFVLWSRTAISTIYNWSFRNENMLFGWYHHSGGGQAPFLYCLAEAKAHEMKFFQVVVVAWHYKWAVQRVLRRWAAKFREGGAK